MPEKEENGQQQPSEEKPVESSQKESDDGKKVSRSKYEKVCAELEKANADKDHWKNEYYKAFADMMNLRKALEEEKNSAIRYRAEGFLENLLPALDSFHMALDAPAPNPEARNYQIGFSYIYNQIVASLTSEGVSEIYPKIGDPFDAATMHAVDKLTTTEVPPGSIARVGAKGYKLHDRLVRAAMVYVAEAPKEKEPDAVEDDKEKEEAHKA